MKKRKMESFGRSDGGDRWFPNYMKPQPVVSGECCDSKYSLRRYPKHAADAKMKGVVDASLCSLKPIVEIDTRHSRHARGGSSHEYCAICDDAKPRGEMRRGSHCRHRYCDECVAEQVRGNVKEDIHRIKCPEKGCKKILDIEFCLDYLGDTNGELIDAWADARREAKVLGNPSRIKCPFLDCSRTFVDDKKEFLIKACPNCWRIFCMRCKVRWHMGMSCLQYEIAKKVKNFLSRWYGEDDEEDDDERLGLFIYTAL